MGAIAIFLNLGYFLWLLLASLYVIGDVNSLGIPIFTPVQQHVVLDYVRIGQDLLPWLFMGWILMVIGLSRQAWHMNPSADGHRTRRRLTCINFISALSQWRQ